MESETCDNCGAKTTRYESTTIDYWFEDDGDGELDLTKAEYEERPEAFMHHCKKCKHSQGFGFYGKAT